MSSGWICKRFQKDLNSSSDRSLLPMAEIKAPVIAESMAAPMPDWSIAPVIWEPTDGMSSIIGLNKPQNDLNSSSVRSLLPTWYELIRIKI